MEQLKNSTKSSKIKKVKIMTDSNSGILQKDGEELGVYVLPMPFTIDGEEYFEEISISKDEFYEKLKKNVDVKTSQPSQAYLTEVWDELLKTNKHTTIQKRLNQ